MDFQNLADSLGILAATALGGLLAIVGSAFLQRTQLRQQQLERRAAVYQELLGMYYRGLQSARTKYNLDDLREAQDRLLGSIQVEAATVASLARSREDREEVAKGITSRLKDVQDNVSVLTDKISREAIFAEDPDEVATDAKKLYLFEARMGLSVSPLILSQSRLVNYIADLDLNLDVRSRDLFVIIRREVNVLEKLMRRELSWSVRHVGWRVALAAYSLRIRLQNHQSIRKVQRRVKELSDGG